MTGGTEGRRIGPWRREVRAGAELLGACTLAIAQPAFGTLSRNVGTLIVRDTTLPALIGLALLIALVPPTLAWAAEVLIGLVVPRARRCAHALLLGAAGGLFALQLLKSLTGLGPTPLVVIAAVAALAVAVLAARTVAFGTLLRFATIALPVFLVQFLLLSPANRAVTGAEVSASGARIGNPARVLMVVLDELPLASILDGSGGVDADLYPNLAALARTSTWYRNTTTVAPDTEKAVPAVVTGRYPAVDLLPIAADHPDSLFRLLGGRYRMNVHEPVERLCPDTICTTRTTSSSGLRGFLSLAREAWSLYTTAAAPERFQTTYEELADIPPARPAAEDFVASLEPSAPGEPVLDYVHILLPHQPWRYLATFQEAVPRGDRLFARSNLIEWKSEGTGAVARSQHLTQMRATDAFLGRVRDRLEAMGEWDDTLVVVTADHGITFAAGEAGRTASRATAPDILWTPLFVKRPGQRAGVVDDRRMETIDVLPTIASALDTEIPWSVDGVPPTGAPRSSVPPRLYQWDGQLQPDDAETAPEGEYLSYDEDRFAEVIGARAAPAGPTEYRTYRVGPYASLVGEPAAPFVRDLPGGPSELYLRTGSPAFGAVDPTAPRIPVLWQRGYVQQLGDTRVIAFAINGIVAGFGFADPQPGSTNDLGYYFAALAPTPLRPGANTITAYAVRGDPSAPVLDPVRIGN